MWLYNTHKRSGENLTVSFAGATATISRFNISLDFTVLNYFIHSNPVNTDTDETTGNCLINEVFVLSGFTWLS